MLLWALLALVFVRGAVSLVGGEAQPAARAPLAAAPSFPDAEAQAFAVDFARAYMSFSPGRQDWVALALEPYLAPSLPEDAGLRVPDQGESQVVEQATVARTRAIDRDRALVTVAATVSNRVVTTRYLTVPVARDSRGGLAVYDYPSLSPPPSRAHVDEPATDDLERSERDALEAVLARFFPVYLAGRSRELEYLLPPGASLRALGQRHRFVELDSLAREPGSARGRQRTVLAAVEARDAESGAQHLLRYRVGLELRERWYVRAINTV